MLGYHPVGTSLIQLLPAHHVYLRLLQRVDFSFVRPLVAPFYSAIGRPSLDPVVFVKLLLVQHLENITSDRKLVELASLHLGIRAFLGYEFAQPLPSHSTISRTRQRLPVTFFEACFTQVVGLCVHQGLLSGQTQVVDSAYIKANASMSRLQPKRALWLAESAPASAEVSTTRLLASAARLQQLRRLQATILQAAPTKPGLRFSNFTHYSPADPEARIAYKIGKPRQLAYRASVSVDAAHHVITHIQADFADGRDSRYLLPLVAATQQRLQQFGLLLHQVVADAGYSSGENYAQLESWRLLAFIPPHGKTRPNDRALPMNSPVTVTSVARASAWHLNDRLSTGREMSKIAIWPSQLTVGTAPVACSVKAKVRKKSAYMTPPTRPVTSVCSVA
jgi:transposase